jgi:poly-beta-1,6-N-acetyl-D-glucosamine N-deacetylase
MRRAACRLLRLTLIPYLARRALQTSKITILVYHRPSAETLERHAAFLQRAYNLISLRRFVEARSRGALHTLPPRSLVISFDDGHRSNYELLPVLERLAAPPTIFVCSGIVDTNRRFWFNLVRNPEPLKLIPDRERVAVLDALQTSDGNSSERDALSRAELNELRRVADIQAHTVTHPILPACSPEKAEQEIRGVKTDLEKGYGLDVYAIAYPNGDYSDREVRLAGEAGYACALTLDLGFNDASTDLLRLRRTPVEDDDDVHVLAVKACGVWGALRRVFWSARRKPPPHGHWDTARQEAMAGAPR